MGKDPYPRPVKDSDTARRPSSSFDVCCALPLGVLSVGISGCGGWRLAMGRRRRTDLLSFCRIQYVLRVHYCHLAVFSVFCEHKNRAMFIEDDMPCVRGVQYPKGYPVFYWQLDGRYSVAVPPEAYLKQQPNPSNSSESHFCFGIRPLTDNQELLQGDSILGDTFMAATYVVFDRDRKQIGFAVPTRVPVLHAEAPDDHNTVRRTEGRITSGPTLAEVAILLSLCIAVIVSATVARQKPRQQVCPLPHESNPASSYGAI